MTQSSILTLLAGNTVVALGLAIVAWVAGRAGRPALAHVAWLLVLVKLLTPPLWRVPMTMPERAASPAQTMHFTPPAVAQDAQAVVTSHLAEHEPGPCRCCRRGGERTRTRC